MDAKKITAEDLKKISGGTLQDAYEYIGELAAKYGVEADDYETLSNMVTEEEMIHVFELLGQ